MQAYCTGERAGKHQNNVSGRGDGSKTNERDVCVCVCVCGAEGERLQAHHRVKMVACVCVGVCVDQVERIQQHPTVKMVVCVCVCGSGGETAAASHSGDDRVCV